jgi:O-antigen ligase
LNTETQFSFLTVETGIPGMLVWAGFVITLIVLGLRRCRNEPDREARVLLAALIAPIAGILALSFISATSDSVPLSPYLWAVGGIVSYWLVALPERRRREASAAGETPAAGARTSLRVGTLVG